MQCLGLASLDPRHRESRGMLTSGSTIGSASASPFFKCGNRDFRADPNRGLPFYLMMPSDAPRQCLSRSLLEEVAQCATLLS